MKHVAVEQFWKRYEMLPVVVQKLVDSNFSIIKQYPNHPLLRLLKVGKIISMRVGSRVRALAYEDGETIIWFWVGTYRQYKILIENSKKHFSKGVRHPG